MNQRDKMRDLFKLFNGDRERVIGAYAEAELSGEVRRVRDIHDLSSIEYASRLFADGIDKGWIGNQEP